MSQLSFLSSENCFKKRVILREDLNVPMVEGKITSYARIDRVLPTLRYLKKNKAAVILLSHFGRPKAGYYDKQYSLAPIAEALSARLGCAVPLVSDWVQQGVEVSPGDIVLCENVRFEPGERENSPVLAQKIAALGDIFVMDAFACVHRKEASIVGIPHYLPAVCGPLLQEELANLARYVDAPNPPIVALVGGSKVSTKIQVLQALIEKVDTLIVGGGMANTFLAAKGYQVGASLYEPGWVEAVTEMCKRAEQIGVHLPIPEDVVVASGVHMPETVRTLSLEAEVLSDTDSIVDIGPKTAEKYAHLLAHSATIVWNGPVGIFEVSAFSQGTRRIAEAVAQSSAVSVAGGGDTLSAIEQFTVPSDISYLCTGGGAFLEYLEGKTLPGIVALEQNRGKHG